MNDSEIIKLFGQDSLRKLESTLQKSYSHGLLFIQENPMLQEESAESFKQNIINFAIDYNLAKACREGLLDFGFRYAKNHAKNCKHIELLHNELILTHSSINNGERVPRESIFRRYLSSTNQISFYGDETLNPPSYGILTHQHRENGNKKAIIYLGIPDSEYGYWCNEINLTLLNSGLMVSVSEEEYEDFKFELRKEQKENQA